MHDKETNLPRPAQAALDRATERHRAAVAELEEKQAVLKDFKRRVADAVARAVAEEHAFTGDVREAVRKLLPDPSIADKLKSLFARKRTIGAGPDPRVAELLRQEAAPFLARREAEVEGAEARAKETAAALLELRIVILTAQAAYLLARLGPIVAERERLCGGLASVIVPPICDLPAADALGRLCDDIAHVHSTGVHRFAESAAQFRALGFEHAHEVDNANATAA